MTPSHPPTTPTSDTELLERAARIRLLALDVDGVLTDGRLHYGNHDEELKSFHIFDGLGIKLLQRAGVEVALITGRSSELVARRAGELGIEEVVQGREDKLQALQELLARRELTLPQVAYMGDDLPDLSAIRAAGLGLTVASGHHFVRSHADWCSRLRGGEGAVREAIEWLLKARGQLQESLEHYL